MNYYKDEELISRKILSENDREIKARETNFSNYMSKKSLYNYKMGQDFLDMQYINNFIFLSGG